MIVEPR